MRSTGMSMALTAATLLAAGPAGAQNSTMPAMAGMPAPACPTTPTALPAVYAGFATPIATAAGAALTLGRAAAVTLATDARFALAPGKLPAPGSFGGSVTFRIATAGTYRVALGSGVWIDVVANGASVTSSAHGHGPACSPVRKTVDFVLKSGTYTLQLSGSKAPTATVMVTRPA